MEGGRRGVKEGRLGVRGRRGAPRLQKPPRLAVMLLRISIVAGSRCGSNGHEIEEQDSSEEGCK